ncbi:fungal-specific transcription factor domain-containing protein [Phellopilus nigrolimitatus]|nr:fungal-specific transcription factor domain-containing protein [Phellopilus nigrolimitatus]
MKANDGEPKPRKRPGRVPVSCAECRRLKMRCDRRHPCENCTKRGCAAICPDGTLTTGKHNRMILADTEELHDKIEALLERIRLLEDALRTAQAAASSQPHPLLTNPSIDLLFQAIPVLQPRDVNIAVRSRPNAEEEDESPLDTSGTLFIGANEETSFLGQTARADYFLNDSDSDDGVEFGRLPREFYNYTWPEAPPSDDSIEETVLSFLPDLNEAYSLCEVYLNYAKWLCLFVSREALYEEFIAHVYHLPNRAWADTPYTCPHRLALVFAIFSLGALFDSSRPPYNPEADDYYHLARVALSFKSSVHETTVYSVMTILHVAFYLEHSDSPQGHEQGWVMLGVANKMGLSMGLHRDSSRWKLDQCISQRRHSAFWQLYIMEAMTSLRYGRPPLLPEAYIDCPLPNDLASQPFDEGHSSYHAWIVQFTRLVQQVRQEAFGVKAPSYSAVLALDKQVRDFKEPEWSAEQFASEGPQVASLIKVRRWCVLQLRETVLLHLHRGFLVDGLSDSPHDTAKRKYGQSVKACFESAHRLIEGLDWIYQQCPDVSMKMSGWFSASVSSTIIMCLLVARCPNSEFARPAMEKLDTVCSVLQRASATNRTALRILEPTQRLRHAARAELDRTRLRILGRAAPPIPIPASEANDMSSASELDRCCGKTHLCTRRTRKPASVAGKQTVHASFSPGPSSQMSPGWDAREMRTSPLSFGSSEGTSSALADPQSCGESFPRSLGLTGDAFVGYPLGSQGLDSTWHSFIQQLGF